jgi:GTPase SAR1 family protein
MPEPWKVALWGPSAAGKTAFLAQLYRRSSTFPTDWKIYPTEEALLFLDSVEVQMNQNRFPVPTAMSETISKVAYRFRHQTTGAEASLLIEDRAGAESEQLSEEGKRRFNEAHGLILLFDPGRDSRSLEGSIEKTLRQLAVAANRGVTQDTRPIAVCLSKSDQLIETPEDLRRAVETPQDFVLEKITPELTGWLLRFCTNFELFPISSAGIRLRHGVVEHSVFRDEELALRLGSEGDPLNLMAPFEWLFEMLERNRQ